MPDDAYPLKDCEGAKTLVDAELAKIPAEYHDAMYRMAEIVYQIGIGIGAAAMAPLDKLLVDSVLEGGRDIAGAVGLARQVKDGVLYYLEAAGPK